MSRRNCKDGSRSINLLQIATPARQENRCCHRPGARDHERDIFDNGHLLTPVFQHQEGPKAVRPRRNCRSINLLQIATPAPMLQHISRQGKLHLQEKMGSTLSREVLHYRPMMQHDQCNSINLLQIVTAAPMLQHIPRQGKVCMHPFVRT
jgi:hypothetical protein